MKKIPTDYKILQQIYDQYIDEYLQHESSNDKRGSKNYVPVDLEAVAKGLGVDPNILFGRLYYHLEKRYGYTNPDNTNVHFFAMKIGQDMHCIHFPYLSSVLASMKSEDRKFWVATCLSIAAIIISIIALIVN